jgi:hypothetical protein
MVRVLAIALTVASAVAAVPAPQNAMSFGGDVNARTLFLSSRAAIGRHGGSVGKLRSLVAKGRTRFLGADGSPSEGTVELRVLLPNRYLRIDTVGAARRQFGFDAGTLVSDVRDTGRPLDTPDRAVAGLLDRARRELVLFVLGAVTYVTSEEPLAFRSMMTSSVTNDPLRLTASGDRLQLTLRFDTRSRTPAEISYSEGGVDVDLTFEDRRTVGGLDLPFHIVKTAGPLTVDELRFDDILVDSPLTAADFKP